MAHFLDDYAERINDILHDTLGGTRFYKQEIVEVAGLIAGLLVTYDAVQDDSREVHCDLSWEAFLQRMSKVKPDWKAVDRAVLEQFVTKPGKTLMGWEGRTIYFIKGGRNPDQWTRDNAVKDATALLIGSRTMWGPLVSEEVRRLREFVPVGPENSREFEHMVRVAFNFLFGAELGQGRAQSRTAPENEGIEIRDVLFQNVAEVGFWKDLKDKYFASEIVVDAKNTDEITRDDLRQLYCYLKPALGFWGFIVCRSPQPERIQAYNRTLFKNFRQERGVLILCDQDLRRMVEMANRGKHASDYLRDRMSEFVRSI